MTRKIYKMADTVSRSEKCKETVKHGVIQSLGQYSDKKNVQHGVIQSLLCSVEETSQYWVIQSLEQYSDKEIVHHGVIQSLKKYIQ